MLTALYAFFAIDRLIEWIWLGAWTVALSAVIAILFLLVKRYDNERE